MTQHYRRERGRMVRGSGSTVDGGWLRGAVHGGSCRTSSNIGDIAQPHTREAGRAQCVKHRAVTDGRHSHTILAEDMGASHNLRFEYQTGAADEAIKLLVFAGLIIVVELDSHARRGFIQGIESAQLLPR